MRASGRLTGNIARSSTAMATIITAATVYDGPVICEVQPTRKDNGDFGREARLALNVATFIRSVLPKRALIAPRALQPRNSKMLRSPRPLQSPSCFTTNLADYDLCNASLTRDTINSWVRSWQ